MNDTFSRLKKLTGVFADDHLADTDGHLDLTL